MPRQPARKKQAAPLKVDDFVDDDYYEFVVLHLMPIMKKTYDEAKRSDNVAIRRDFGFICKEGGEYLAYVTKDNKYYRGRYDYKLADFERPHAEFGLEVVLTYTPQQAA